jgi:hypothetical protein
VEAGPSSVGKHKRGKPLKSGQRVFILNVFNELSKTNPRLAVKQAANLR